MARKPPPIMKKKGSRGKIALKKRRDIAVMRAVKRSPDFNVLKNVIVISFWRLIPCSIVKVKKFK